MADLGRPAGRVAMPRLPRPPVSGGTVHVVGRCNNREFCFTTPEDFRLLIARLGAMARVYAVTLYAYTLMANHVHLLLEAPLREPVARPLRWFFRETTRDWQRTHGHRGHFAEELEAPVRRIHRFAPRRYQVPSSSRSAGSCLSS